MLHGSRAGGSDARRDDPSALMIQLKYYARYD